jgi:hypothetical protein
MEEETHKWLQIVPDFVPGPEQLRCTVAAVQHIDGQLVAAVCTFEAVGR